MTGLKNRLPHIRKGRRPAKRGGLFSAVVALVAGVAMVLPSGAAVADQPSEGSQASAQVQSQSSQRPSQTQQTQGAQQSGQATQSGQGQASQSQTPSQSSPSGHSQRPTRTQAEGTGQTRSHHQSPQSSAQGGSAASQSASQSQSAPRGGQSSLPSAQGLAPRGGSLLRSGCRIDIDAIADCFPDYTMELAVIDALRPASYTYGDTFTTSMANSITTLNADGTASLTGVDLLPNLVTLNASGDWTLDDVSPLSGLTHLRTLNLHEDNISNISALSGLTGLTRLDLGNNNGISDLSPLAGMTHLTYLDVSQNAVSSISALSGMTDLETVILKDGYITDITPLSNSSASLRTLDLENNISIADYSPLTSMTNMTSLSLEFDPIGDAVLASVAGSMANLTTLKVAECNITNPSPIGSLTRLQFLEIFRNHISNVAVFANMPTLTYLDLAENNIIDISPLTASTAQLSGLTFLGLVDQRVTEVPKAPSTALTAHGGKLTSSPDTYAAMDTSYTPSPATGWSYNASTGTMTWPSTTPAPTSLRFGFSSPVTIGGASDTFDGTVTRGVQVLRGVTYEIGPDGGSWISVTPATDSVDDGDPVASAPTITGLTPPTGWHMDGWDYASSHNGASLGTFKFGTLPTATAVTQDIWVRPHWVRNTHYVHYTAGTGGTWNPLPGAVQVSYGLTVAQPSLTGLAPSAGWHQNGWVYAASATGSSLGSFTFGSTTMQDKDIWVRPNWVRSSYAISYDWNGGSWAGSALPTTAVYGDAVRAPSSAGVTAAAHQHFGHWEYKTTPTGSWTRFSGSFAMPAGDVVIRPVWAQTTHQVTFDPNNGSSTTTSTVNDGDTIAEPSVSKAGWHVDYWATVSNGRHWNFATDTVTADVSLTAHWVRTSYTVAYEPGAGASWSPLPGSDSVPYESTVSQPSVAGLVAPAGHHQDGWVYASSAGGPSLGSFTFGSTPMPAYNIWIRPNWVVDGTSGNGGGSTPGHGGNTPSHGGGNTPGHGSPSNGGSGASTGPNASGSHTSSSPNASDSPKTGVGATIKKELSKTGSAIGVPAGLMAALLVLAVGLEILRAGKSRRGRHGQLD
ncbi:leucine-rich repeat domain-containing protein [Bifidobacterium sp. ESL0682]|uniref:leucine-rich repeat domain-containing protein n=1 Tax=Bifidobacterium sp. ESL0682 TaxID=2983212 RepID=UPI0023F868F8|nr:leucine-rich repeat domain-containing protein [Bifidobacterium sp. ESL0682]WEV41964.1 leucine-rich repeat domain-containing protein [Bifidobacterium sp. ESL0682]